jgi:nicotinate-nucleotide pyrophosphorylase (carboxylating)
VVWDAQVEKDLRALVQLAIREDLDTHGDCTTLSLVPKDALGRAALVSRRAGVIAGLRAVSIVLHEFDRRLRWFAQREDGHRVEPGDSVGRIEGPASSLLTSERVVLNLLARLSGVATLTKKYVEAVKGTRARIYDTRKTTPGWRRLEKYAVRCGGGRNHRTGLFDAVLIKDNHLAAGIRTGEFDSRFTPAEAVNNARSYIRRHAAPDARDMIVEIEVDTIAQLEQILPSEPDIVLLDNMTLDQLRRAVQCRDATAPKVELEASGGVSLQTVRDIAKTGIDRISVGALTHSAISLDLALDWIVT